MSSQATSSALLAQFKAAKRLPSPPGTAIQVLALCRAEDVEVKQIADTVMSDPALSARLLRFANSPISGLRREVTSIREAVLLLGIRTVKLTALGFSLATLETVSDCPEFDIRRFWAESFLRAVVARRIAGTLTNVDREDAFTIGLLAAIGQLALAQGLRERYSQVLAAAGKGRPLAEAEQDAIGTDHVQVGANLLQEWHLPPTLVEGVASQQVVIEPQRRQTPGQRLAQAIRMANELVPHLVALVADPRDSMDATVGAAARILGLDRAIAQVILEQILTDYRQVETMFEVRLQSPASAMDLYAEAQEEATRVSVVTQLEQAQIVAANRDLLHRATTDALTGVANRAKFDEWIREEAARFRRGHGDFGLIILDVDLFKHFNDTYGHRIGDLVLKRVATAIGNVLREVDLLARYGGEEFAVIVPHTDRRGACIVAARVQRCVEEMRIEVNDQRLGVTISSGLVVAGDFPKAPAADQLVAAADAQLYLSKNAGRNTWSYLGRSASKLPAPPAAAATR